MSSPSTTPPPVAPAADDSTAELPVLDPAEAIDPDEAHASTDTWVSFPPVRPEPARHLEATLEALSAELRSAQQLVHSKTDRMVQLEREREEAYGAVAAAETRARALQAQLEGAQGAASAHTAQVSELTRARLAAEQRAAGIAAELAHLRAGGDENANLAELRAAAEQRAAQLDAELSRLQAAAREHAAEFAELIRTRTVAEE